MLLTKDKGLLGNKFTEILKQGKVYRCYKIPAYDGLAILGPLYAKMMLAGAIGFSNKESGQMMSFINDMIKREGFEELLATADRLFKFITVVVGDDEIALENRHTINAHVKDMKDLIDILGECLKYNMDFLGGGTPAKSQASSQEEILDTSRQTASTL